jgi:hypothetical protein
MDMHLDSTPLAKHKPTHRSSVSNGSRLFAPQTTDGRSLMGRRFRDLVQDIALDLGGTEMLSTGQLQLIRRAAMLSVQCEALEAEAVSGREFDTETFGQLTDRLGRCFQRLGLKRAARDISPDSEVVAHFKRRQRGPA